MSFYILHTLTFPLTFDFVSFFWHICLWILPSDVKRRGMPEVLHPDGDDLTPARAVDSSSISTVASTLSEGTASPSMTPQVQMPKSPTPQRANDRPKGKELVVVTSKRTHDGNEAKPSRKRPSQGIQLSDPSDLQDVVPLMALALALHASQGEGSSGFSSLPWTREGFTLPESRRDLDGLAQEIQ